MVFFVGGGGRRSFGGGVGIRDSGQAWIQFISRYESALSKKLNPDTTMQSVPMETPD
jgi:hypothetical protein